MMRLMNLKQYVDTERGVAANLARALGVSPVMISQWISGVKAVPAERCPVIERATGGAVRCEELRPDVEWNVLREFSSEAGTEGAPPFPSPTPAEAAEPHTAG